LEDEGSFRYSNLSELLEIVLRDVKIIELQEVEPDVPFLLLETEVLEAQLRHGWKNPRGVKRVAV